VAPPDPRRQDFNKLDFVLHVYVRKLSCKFKFFWAINSWEEIFSMTPPYFYIFVIISPLKRTWSLIWTNLNSPYPRIICTKFDWIWPAGSGRDFFFKIQCISALLLLSPLGEGEFPSFEQTWIPSPQGWFMSSLVKIGPVVLEKILKWPYPIFIFVIISL
jgi:hypothetical protein